MTGVRSDSARVKVEIDAARSTVPCTDCGIQPPRRCLGPTGRPLLSIHSARHRAFLRERDGG